MAMRVAERFAGTPQDDVPPDFVGDPETHGIEDPRGGGFSIMQNLQKSLVKEQKETLAEPVENAKNASVRSMSAAVREAMYWCSPGRTYRTTKGEQEGGIATCPKCKAQMEQERFTRSEKMYRCPECGFKIPTGKVTTTKIEIEVEPDGEVEVEMTTSSLKSRRGR